MDSTLEYLLEQLNVYLTRPRPVPERLITSGRHFTRWVQERIRYDQQILINAIICSSSVMQEKLRMILFQIEEEFQEITTIKSLPYPYQDLQQMKAVIDGLINHFNSPILAKDVIQALADSNRYSEEKSGYIILTIINTPVIS